jgi:hypothetical protein
VKFYTGHYVGIGGGMTSTNLADTLEEVKGLPAVAGIMKRYEWADLEVAKDDYRFGQIQSDLDAAQAKGKKLAIMIMYKFGNPLPAYLASMENGDYFYTLGGAGTGPYSTGKLAKFENPWVVDRFLLFINALKRFDSHPALAAVIYPETAMGFDMSTVNAAGFYEGIKRIDRVTACLFRATPIFQLTNFPVKYIDGLIRNEIKFGAGFGVADVMPADTSLTKPGAAYSYFPLANGTVPTSAIIAGSNYRYDSHEDFKNGIENGLSYDDSVHRLGAYAAETLHTNFIWWKRDSAADKYYQAVLKALANGSLPTPANVCPSMFICR